MVSTRKWWKSKLLMGLLVIRVSHPYESDVHKTRMWKLGNRVSAFKGNDSIFVVKFIVLASLPTAREGNVFTGVCQSVCLQSASWLLGHCSSLLAGSSVLILVGYSVTDSSLIPRSRYASYWNAFLFFKTIIHRFY